MYIYIYIYTPSTQVMFLSERMGHQIVSTRGKDRPDDIQLNNKLHEFNLIYNTMI